MGGLRPNTRRTGIAAYMDKRPYAGIAALTDPKRSGLAAYFDQTRNPGLGALTDPRRSALARYMEKTYPTGRSAALAARQDPLSAAFIARQRPFAGISALADKQRYSGLPAYFDKNPYLGTAPAALQKRLVATSPGRSAMVEKLAAAMEVQEQRLRPAPRLPEPPPPPARVAPLRVSRVVAQQVRIENRAYQEIINAAPLWAAMLQRLEQLAEYEAAAEAREQAVEEREQRAEEREQRSEEREERMLEQNRFMVGLTAAAVVFAVVSIVVQLTVGL